MNMDVLLPVRIPIDIPISQLSSKVEAKTVHIHLGNRDTEQQNGENTTNEHWSMSISRRVV